NRANQPSTYARRQLERTEKMLERAAKKATMTGNCCSLCWTRECQTEQVRASLREIPYAQPSTCDWRVRTSESLAPRHGFEPRFTAPTRISRLSCVLDVDASDCWPARSVEFTA